MEVEFQHLDLRYEKLRKQDKRREAQLLGSLASHGQQMPIVVVASKGAERVVIDGYKRVRALRRLAYDTVVATEWPGSELEALLMVRALRAEAGVDALEEAWLLQELVGRFGLGQEELGRRLCRSKSWVSRRLALATELPAEIQAAVQGGQLAAYAATKYLVPLARANTKAAMTMALASVQLRLTTRQVGRLYQGYVTGSTRTRTMILEEPALFLRTQERAAPPTEPRAPAQELIVDLGALGGIARRLGRKLSAGVWRQLPGWERDEVAVHARRARAETDELFHRLDKEKSDAGPEHTNCDPQAAGTGPRDTAHRPSPGDLAPGGT
jgi:ParB family transcriptional regulator, chromosome partitioning protein